MYSSRSGRAPTPTRTWRRWARAGRRALSHEALDELPDSPPLAHLRQVLVGVGALPERDEYMVRLERFLTSLLASQPDPEQRKVLHQYAIWHLLRRLRRRSNGRP
ncbi:hypothetical protein ABMX48_36400 [Streptomyces cavourensis]